MEAFIVVSIQDEEITRGLYVAGPIAGESHLAMGGTRLHVKLATHCNRWKGKEETILAHVVIGCGVYIYNQRWTSIIYLNTHSMSGEGLKDRRDMIWYSR